MIPEPDCTQIGVIHGRFQILHNDHLKYLLAGKKHCCHLVVGITSPDPHEVRMEVEVVDRQLSEPVANPLTYYERYLLVRDALCDAGIATADISIVPLPISQPERYRYYVPLDATFFLSVYDDRGRRKLEYLQLLRLKTQVLWQVKSEEKGISGAQVRRRMIDGTPWEHLVPPVVADHLKQWNIEDRLRRLNARRHR